MPEKTKKTIKYDEISGHRIGMEHRKAVATTATGHTLYSAPVFVPDNVRGKALSASSLGRGKTTSSGGANAKPVKSKSGADCFGKTTCGKPNQ